MNHIEKRDTIIDQLVKDHSSILYRGRIAFLSPSRIPPRVYDFWGHVFDSP